MKEKRSMVKDTRETANLRDYLREHHREVHELIVTEANRETRTYNQMVTHILRKWAHYLPIADTITRVDDFLDGMVSPDEGDSDVTTG